MIRKITIILVVIAFAAIAMATPPTATIQSPNQTGMTSMDKDKAPPPDIVPALTLQPVLIMVVKRPNVSETTAAQPTTGAILIILRIKADRPPTANHPATKGAQPLVATIAIGKANSGENGRQPDDPNNNSAKTQAPTATNVVDAT